MKVNTNPLSLLAQRRLGQVARRQEEESLRLSSGNRVYRAAFDPAGLAISAKLNAKSVSNLQAQRNVNDGVSLLQVAEGTLDTLHKIGGRLRELAMQAANDTVGVHEREIANREFVSLKDEVKRLTSSTKFNGNHILNGKGSVYDIQIGVNNNNREDRVSYNLEDVLKSANNFGLASVNITSKVGAQNSFRAIDGMLEEISSSRAKLGSAMNRMTSSLNNLQIHRENVEKSKSKIQDADVAKEASDHAKDEIIKNATLDMLRLVNQSPSHVAKLLG
ncbi:flagellin [Halobacteriovorax sp. GB3]|uniref:flagellin N-terminal helical domain-containing protein n=1 Tax=Halobacteriovorax sp. GB3 TaxID=2719615 RepID=UPI0023609419|nr:flagellin [Halobacteriovorax sp. GB3]MDD0851961.1 flagellin [Halobacteriovorax sp. GB3]